MKSRKNLIKAGILFISLTIILPTIATTAIEVNTRTIPENVPLSMDNDTTPPTVKIEKPVRGVYIRDKKIFPLLMRPTLVSLIIGNITIVVNATDNATENESGIDKVVFYGGFRGNRLLDEDTEEPYTYNLKRDRIRLIHRQKIKVVAYDKAGNSASDKIIIRKILWLLREIFLKY